MIGVMEYVNGQNTVSAKSPENDRVEVIYFHGKQRCATCLAIEERAKEVIDAEFSKEVKDGKLVYKTIDISTTEGEALADKYEVSWSALYVNNWKDGKESRSNMTEFSFGNARNNPVKFKKGLSEKIRKALR